MMQSLISMLMCMGTAFFIGFRNLRLLHLFQQEEYDGPRFLRWLIAARAFDRRGTLVALPAAALTCFNIPPVVIAALAALALFILGVKESIQLKAAKKKLVMTQRVKRIVYVAIALYVSILVPVFLIGYIGAQLWLTWLLIAVLFQLIPLVLVAANAILAPWEARIQRGFLKEAQEKFHKIDPYVVGITGSYGKTSSKKLLAHLMNNALGPTFSTPGSINTPMGITRRIRENMAPGTKYAVIEMAAYRRGSIARLCALTPPHAALITNVGIMHLERFGSPENVLLAKSELAQAVPPGGLLVCNGDNPGSLRIAREHAKERTLLFGLNADGGKLDCWASGAEITQEGTRFKLHWQGECYDAFTPQFGTAALLNILGAFTMACALGASPEYVLALIRSIPAETNRLSATQAGGAIWLNDAYSSNPAGFRSALEVMRAMPGKRRILITPGMVELGPVQAEENRKLAIAAAAVCDLILVVGGTNREAWASGMAEAKLPSEHFMFCTARDEALAYVRENSAEGDIVLIENDLPDLYEKKPSF